MKKFLGLLLSAGLLLSFTACGDDNKDEGETTPPDHFTCVVKTTPSENSVAVTATPAKGFSETSYQLWVVKQGDYKAEVPATAESCKGTFTKTFEGLSANTAYYVVVYEAETGYKQTSFKTTESTKAPSKCLEGSNYYLLGLDDVSVQKIAGKITSDLRPDGMTMNIDWWNVSAFEVGTCTGPNSLEEVEGWMSLIIATNADWFGAAYHLINPEAVGGDVTQEIYDIAQQRRSHLQEIVDNAGDYTMHFAMKSNAGGNYSIGMFNSCIDGGIKTIIGTENDTYGFKRDGEWHEIEIPMSVFVTSPKFDISQVNVFQITQSEQPYPKDINLDAVFIYKKAK